MAVLDIAGKTITLKVVYYGCALAGKTANLVTLHRLTDPDGQHGLVAIATQDDRTLFFDLLPVDLGRVGGLTVHVKAYTVPGQVHYEITRRQVLAGADAVVLVVDSSPSEAKANHWMLDNLRMNLKSNGLDPDKIPTVLQWNKRDLPGVRPVAELAAELNAREYPAQEAVAITGAGVVETFAAALKAALRQAYARASRSPATPELLDHTVDLALEQARTRAPSIPETAPAAFDHRVDMAAYHEKWAEKGRDRRILDQETLLSEAVKTNMELAEKLDDLHGAQAANELRGSMLEALGRLTPAVVDPSRAALPKGLVPMLLTACGRSRGSLLVFRPGEKVMEDREVVPGGKDPLNAAVAPSLGSAAFRLCQGASVRWIEDLAGEVFFDSAPPEAQGVLSALVAPLACDGAAFGALVVYGTVHESPPGSCERGFWEICSSLLSLSLHWRGLRKRLTRLETPAPASSSGSPSR
ncbi:MAG: GTPase domain-containing protein [Acidobacteriia bacterium]|nr:GTPase domain-containing protein [Terriglobia bacterium]